MTEPAAAEAVVHMESEALTVETFEYRTEDPWVTVLPLQTLLASHYETLSTSPILQPFRLLNINKNILSYIKQARVNLATGGEDLAESRNMMRIFDMAFKRLISTSFEADDDLKEVKEFYDNIWSIHNDDPSTFTGTEVLTNLLTIDPLYLEPNFLTSLLTWDPTLLLPISSPIHFQILLNFLYQVYEKSRSSNSNSRRVLKFSQDFIQLVQKTAGAKIISFLPLPLQPLLAFISEVEGLDNEITIQEQVNELADQIFKHHSDQTKSITFILKSVLVGSKSKFMEFQEQGSTKTKINVRLDKFPYLYMALHQDSIK